MAVTKNRLTMDTLNDEGVIMLAETILSEIRIEGDRILETIRKDPNNKEFLQQAGRMIEFLKSDYYNIISMGHGQEASYDYTDRLKLAIRQGRNRRKKK